MDDFRHCEHRSQLAALYTIYQNLTLPDSIGINKALIWDLLAGCPCLPFYYKSQLIQNLHTFTDDRWQEFIDYLQNQKKVLLDAHPHYQQLIEQLFIGLSEGKIIDIYDLAGMHCHLPLDKSPEFPVIAIDLHLYCLFHDVLFDSDELDVIERTLESIQQRNLLANSNAWLCYAHLQAVALRNPVSALKSCELALELDENNDNAWFYLGRMLTMPDIQNIQAAEDAHRRCLSINPESTQCLHALAELLFRHYDNRLDAASLCRQILLFDEDNLQAWRLLGEIQHISGFWDDAEKSYLEAIDRHNDELAWHAIGVLFVQQRRFDEAKKAFLEALQISPNNAAIWNSLGHVLHPYLNDRTKATEAFQMAAQLAPDNVDFSSDLENLKK